MVELFCFLLAKCQIKKKRWGTADWIDIILTCNCRIPYYFLSRNNLLASKIWNIKYKYELLLSDPPVESTAPLAVHPSTSQLLQTPDKLTPCDWTAAHEFLLTSAAGLPHHDQRSCRNCMWPVCLFAPKMQILWDYPCCHLKRRNKQKETKRTFIFLTGSNTLFPPLLISSWHL